MPGDARSRLLAPKPMRYFLQTTRRASWQALGLIALIFILVPPDRFTGQERDPVKQATSNPVHVQMHNVMYHFQDNVAVHIRQLAGELVPTRNASLPIFDVKNSFTLRVDAGEMAITVQSLANVLNQYVLAGKDAPVKAVTIKIENGRVKIKGKLHNKGDISFETESTLSVTDDGKIRLHAEKIRALHLPAKGIMDLFGLEIADLIKTGKVQGVKAEKDDLILDPELALPPPHIAGRVTTVRLEGDHIVQIFGDPQKYKWETVSAKNYMAYRGNLLRFGKLTMSDTDLVLIDPDPRDAFDFYLDHYKDQLIAGYSKTTSASGLRVFMVDYNKLSLGSRGSATHAKH